MFGSTILDVAIGLILFFLILSLVCSAINEAFAALTRQRASSLEAGIKNLLGSEWAGDFYQHGLIRGLSRMSDDQTKVKRKPSYIPSETFVLAMVDSAAKLDPATRSPLPDDLANTISGEAANVIGRLPVGGAAREALMVLAKEAGNDVQKFRKGVEKWFNDAMDRVSGWYKRKTQLIVFVVAILVVGMANADTFALASALWSNSSLRAAAVAQANQTVASGQPQTASVQDAVKKLQDLGLPLGWSFQKDDPRSVQNGLWGWLAKVAGLLITGAAITLGAPFWFDLLKKFVGVRGSGANPAEEQAKAEKKG